MQSLNTSKQTFLQKKIKVYYLAFFNFETLSQLIIIKIKLIILYMS